MDGSRDSFRVYFFIFVTIFKIQKHKNNSSPPPSWPCIQLPNIPTNLFSDFVEMQNRNGIGEIMQIQKLLQTFGSKLGQVVVV